MYALISQLRHGPLRSLTSVWRHAGRIYRGFQAATGIPRGVAKKIGPYGPFQLSGRFAFSNYENWGGAHNASFTACIELCRDRRCVLDVGAHIGLVALPASRMLQATGCLFAFEPAAGNLHYLRDHVELNRINNVEVLDLLVGAEEQDAVPFFEQSGDSGLNSLMPRSGDGRFVETVRRQVSIDSFCRERGLKPDLIKIDVEGAEVQVLEGARQTLSAARPLIVLSVHPRQLRDLGESVEKLGRLIGELGYQVRTADDRPTTKLAFDEYLLRPVE